MPKKSTKTVKPPPRAAHLPVINMTPPRTPSEREIEVALRQCNGKLTLASQMLGIAFLTLRRLVNENPVLRAVVEEIREGVVDAAEYTLEEAAIKDRDMGAVALILKAQGKDRGWGDEVVVNVRQQGAKEQLERVFSRLSQPALLEILAALEEEI